jgi:hypothetical protein
MQLLALTSAEIAFLKAPGPITPGAATADAAHDNLQTRLARKLAATLTARLRLPVQIQTMAAAAPDPAPSDSAPPTPIWQPDAALATLWLTRRLGGQQVTGVATFVPRSLLDTLDAALAECWLDAPAHATPPVLAWHLASDLAQATLVVRLPPHSTDMTRWAREIIRHG